MPVRWYGIMMAAAFFAGLWTATRRGRRVNVSADTITDVTLWLMIGSIVGARFVYVTTYWKQEFAGGPFREVFMVQHGGLVYYGGLIGASLAGMAYLWWKQLPVWKIADIVAPSIALGSAIGRVGCLLNGCCYGRTCDDLPWGIRFPADHETHGLKVHPTEIYDGVLNLLLYLGLAWMFRRRKFDGEIFALYFIGYAICRFIVEFFRGDYPPDHIHAGLFTPAQLLCGPILLAGVAGWFWFSRRSTLSRTASVEK